MHKNLLARELLTRGWSLNQSYSWGTDFIVLCDNLTLGTYPTAAAKRVLARPDLLSKLGITPTSLALEAQPRLGPQVPGVIKLLLKNFQ